MYNWWMYVRTMFEKPYALKSSSFECDKGNLRRIYGKCICISRAAVDYIMCEIELRKQDDRGKDPLTWLLKWEDKYKRYLVRMKSEKEDEGIEARETPSEEVVKLCQEDPEGWCYIRIRNQAVLQRVFKNPKASPEAILRSFLTLGAEAKTEIKFYTILARDYRTELVMGPYIDVLFRFLLFLHPKECLAIVEDNIQNHDNEDLMQYNRKLLKDYKSLVKAFMMFEESDDRTNMVKILRRTGEFVQAKIEKIYIDLKDSEDLEGDIRTAEDLFKDKMHGVMKTDASKENSLVDRLLQMAG